MRRKVSGRIVLTAVPIAVMSSPRDQKIQREFGLRVRQLRRGEGLSQEELAYSCGLDRTYIGSVERGERNISLVTAVRL